MAGYHEALTRLFLKGGFPARAASPGRSSARARPASSTFIEPVPRPTQVAKTSRQKRVMRRLRNGMETDMTHPGQILAKHLSALGLTASDLARDIHVPVNRVTAIINGQRGITADTALRLGHWFGVDPEDWLELQLQYELAVARREAGAKIRALPSLADRGER